MTARHATEELLKTYEAEEWLFLSLPRPKHRCSCFVAFTRSGRPLSQPLGVQAMVLPGSDSGPFACTALMPPVMLRRA